LLKDNPYTLNELAKKLRIKAGGSLSTYLANLERAEFISSYVSMDMPINSKFRKYKLSDEYLIFYFQYIYPNLTTINKRKSKRLFEDLCEKYWKPWLGYAFERFCVKNAIHLAQKMNFADQVLDYAPYFGRESKNFQIDLIYKRMDKVITLCEIKYHDSLIDTSIIPEVNKKVELLKLPRGHTLEKALISLYGPSEPLKNTEYFHHNITLDDLL